MRFHGAACGNVNPRRSAGFVSADLVHHLHRFDDRDYLTGLYRIALLDRNLDHDAVHRRNDVVAARRDGALFVRGTRRRFAG